MSARPRVAVIGTGGTISLDGRHSLDLYEYMDFGTRREIDEIVGRFPELSEFAEIDPVPFRLLPSSAVSAADWLDLVRLIHDIAAGPDAPDGFVITHGTATLEETAYFLNLTLKVPQTVVVTGAQRPLNALGSDAGPNLLCAVRVAAAEESRGLGVLVVFNEEIHGARDVTKTSTNRLQTFQSRDLGVLGYVDADGRIAIYRRPARRHAPDVEFDMSGLEDLPRVDICVTYAGADGASIRACADAGAAAVVMASVAPGVMTPDQNDAIDEARSRGVVIVQSTRSGSGRALRRAVMKDRSIVAADNLIPQKARVLTMIGLTLTRDSDRLQDLFDVY